MKTGIFNFLTQCSLVFFIWLSGQLMHAQQNQAFWDKVRFGGSIGAAFGSGYTDVALAPGALYEVNEYVGVGLSLHGSYVKQRDYFTSVMYGATAITVFNPLPQVQLSAELEQLRVNLEASERWGGYKRDFWNTALFLGAGYRAGNVTIGLRYNVLFRQDDMVYSDALMPFIRVYF